MTKTEAEAKREALQQAYKESIVESNAVFLACLGAGMKVSPHQISAFRTRPEVIGLKHIPALENVFRGLGIITASVPKKETEKAL